MALLALPLKQLSYIRTGLPDFRTEFQRILERGCCAQLFRMTQDLQAAKSNYQGQLRNPKLAEDSAWLW
jgi:hypothetical protein